MDYGKFITLIYERKCLWDKSDYNYHLRNSQRNSWKEVASEMNKPVDDLKKKWRGLRDTFRRELKKTITVNSGDSTKTENVSRWPYFKILLFLKHTMTRRELKGDIPIGNDDSDSEANSNQSVLSPSQDIVPATRHQFQSPLRKKLKQWKTDKVDGKPLHNTEKKLNHFEQSSPDSDAQFLMSLHPFLKELPKSRKLIVRAKLQQVLIEEQNDNTTCEISKLAS